MNISNKEYTEMVKKASPPSRKGMNALKAFLSGGLICAIGQALGGLYRALGAQEEDADMLVTLTLIVLTAVLTALGIFDRIAKHAGAGTFVPVTGFANAVVSPAMEFASEGRVLGTAAQMFRIAGPVLVYGCALSAAYGFFYWLFR
ncbi:MAG: SpoVA/SpoVAEb family sporulation membrane protein [Clostridia bacterium]|nr:SpoVA/SpoVAEb family sporulation membrane protein [Clostridia bacterium]